jgi:hypothetical protein
MTLKMDVACSPRMLVSTYKSVMSQPRRPHCEQSPPSRPENLYTSNSANKRFHAPNITVLPSFIEEDSPFQNTGTVLEQTKIRSWVLTRPKTKHDSAAKGQQQITGLDHYSSYPEFVKVRQEVCLMP